MITAQSPACEQGCWRRSPHYVPFKPGQEAEPERLRAPARFALIVFV